MKNNLLRLVVSDDNDPGKTTLTDMNGTPVNGVKSFAVVMEAGKPVSVMVSLSSMGVEMHGLPAVFDQNELIDALVARIKQLKADFEAVRVDTEGLFGARVKAAAFDHLAPHIKDLQRLAQTKILACEPGQDVVIAAINQIERDHFAKQSAPQQDDKDDALKLCVERIKKLQHALVMEAMRKPEQFDRFKALVDCGIVPCEEGGDPIEAGAKFIEAALYAQLLPDPITDGLKAVLHQIACGSYVERGQQFKDGHFRIVAYVREPHQSGGPIISDAQELEIVRKLARDAVPFEEGQAATMRLAQTFPMVVPSPLPDMTDANPLHP